MTSRSRAAAVVDTDILVDHLRGHRRLQVERALAYSTVSRAELFAGTDSVAVIRTLLDALVEVDLDRTIAETAGGIRRSRGLAMPDAIVAATALGLGVPLVTRNARHFRGIAGLIVTSTVGSLGQGDR